MLINFAHVVVSSGEFNGTGSWGAFAHPHSQIPRSPNGACKVKGCLLLRLSVRPAQELIYRRVRGPPVSQREQVLHIFQVFIVSKLGLM